MILVDANILLYAYNSTSEFHLSGKKWFEEALSSSQPIRFSWNTIHSFLRITTNIRVYPNPFTPTEAIGAVSEWFALPHVDILEPQERYFEIFSQLMIKSQIRGPLVIYAHLAALALEHGAQICTHDADFSRFPDLSIIDPCK